jgi:hypothetical protein
MAKAEKLFRKLCSMPTHSTPLEVSELTWPFPTQKLFVAFESSVFCGCKRFISCILLSRATEHADNSWKQISCEEICLAALPC